MMVDTSRIPRTGDRLDWWRKPQSDVAQLRADIQRVGRDLLKNGFTFATQSLVIKGDGQIIGEGTGELDWNGPAHFGGDTAIDGDTTIGGDTTIQGTLGIESFTTIEGTLGIDGDTTVGGDTHFSGDLLIDGNTTINGTLNIGAGLIGDSALASQITSDAERQDNSSYTPSTSWTTGASVTLNRPSWATAAIITASGFLYPRISATAGSPYCYMRIRTGTDISPISGAPGGDPPIPMSMTWPTKIISPPSQITVSVQSQASFAGQYDSGTAAIGAVVQWYR